MRLDICASIVRRIDTEAIRTNQVSPDANDPQRGQRFEIGRRRMSREFIISRHGFSNLTTDGSTELLGKYDVKKEPSIQTRFDLVASSTGV